jgi:hypothetical protein
MIHACELSGAFRIGFWKEVLIGISGRPSGMNLYRRRHFPVQELKLEKS